MANEITVKLSLIVNKNGAKYERHESFKDDMTGDAWDTGVVDITTSGLQLTDLEVGTYGWVYVKNLSSGTDYIDIGWRDTGLGSADDIACRLYAGESSIFKTPAKTALFADANGSTQALEYAIIEL